MAGQRGRDVLIKVESESQPDTFVTVAGIRTSEFELNAASVDGTAADSPAGWRELIDGAGVKSARVRGRGVFKDAESDATLRTLFFAGRAVRCVLIVPGFGQLEGRFHVRDLKWGGTYDGEATLSIGLESASEIVFQAAP
ncbi:MAG: phage major tail protein, TP901-1 family [Pseudomonadota bacterium]